MTGCLASNHGDLLANEVRLSQPLRASIATILTERNICNYIRATAAPFSLKLASGIVLRLDIT